MSNPRQMFIESGQLGYNLLLGLTSSWLSIQQIIGNCINVPPYMWRKDNGAGSHWTLAGAWRVKLLEEDQERLTVNGCKVELRIRPYQILTLRLMLK